MARFDPALPPREFLETWRQFYFNAKDDLRTYRRKYDKNFMGIFFQALLALA